MNMAMMFLILNVAKSANFFTNSSTKLDRSKVSEIVEVCVDFVTKQWQGNNSIEAIIPVPPSKSRSFQPVIQVAKGLSTQLHIPFSASYLNKVKQTPELKNMFDYQQRLEVLGDAFSVRSLALQGKNVLLFDDLYRSGATIHAITQVLYEKGQVSKVMVLTLTKTRSKS